MCQISAVESGQKLFILSDFDKKSTCQVQCPRMQKAGYGFRAGRRVEVGESESSAVLPVLLMCHVRTQKCPRKKDPALGSRLTEGTNDRPHHCQSNKPLSSSSCSSFSLTMNPSESSEWGGTKMSVTLRCMFLSLGKGET